MASNIKQRYATSFVDYVKAVRDAELPIPAKLGNHCHHLLFQLASYVNHNGKCYPGYPLLERKVHMSSKTISACVKALEEIGVLSHVKGHSNQHKKLANEYTLNLIAIQALIPAETVESADFPKKVADFPPGVADFPKKVADFPPGVADFPDGVATPPQERPSTQVPQEPNMKNPKYPEVPPAHKFLGRFLETPPREGPDSTKAEAHKSAAPPEESQQKPVILKPDPEATTAYMDPLRKEAKEQGIDFTAYLGRADVLRRASVLREQAQAA